MKTLCVTGHRPAKLPWKYKKEGLEYDEYCESLSCYIDDCIRHGYTHFISGMALGVDMDFAETVLDFKAQYGFPILLECAIPCPNQTLKWASTEIDRYNRILGNADKITLVNDHYFQHVCLYVTDIWLTIPTPCLPFGTVKKVAGLGKQSSTRALKTRKSI